MYVMVEILKVKGGKNYRNPHKGKRKFDRLGHLPIYVEVYDELLTNTISFLNQDIVNGLDLCGMEWSLVQMRCRS